MSSTRFIQQHIIELNEKPASSLLMNKELQNIYKGTNELDDEAKIHRAKQADPTLADTATEKHVTNAQTKKWEDTANTFSGVSPSSFVAATEVVTTATANKILKLNADGKLPTDIVGNATTASDSLLLNGKSDTAFQEVAEKDQPGGYAGLDATGKISDSAGAVPTGAVAYFSKNTPPDGWLKCNGAEISRTAYAGLFSAVGTVFGAGDGTTTFQLPDLRGEFLRGLDDGRGVDSERTLGTLQDEATAPNGLYLSLQRAKDSTSMPSVNSGNNTSPFNANGGTTAYVFIESTPGTSTIKSTDSETRPRNIALLACIKY